MAKPLNSLGLHHPPTLGGVMYGGHVEEVGVMSRGLTRELSEGEGGCKIHSRH